MSTNTNPQISVILPCLNEEQAIGGCIDNVKDAIRENSLSAEVIVVDNGSLDKSPEVIKAKNVELVLEPERGYGAAYLSGLAAARGKYLFLADSDGSYDFKEIPRFIDELEKGSDIVIGNRFGGKIENGAMPWAHRYIGNPLLSGILRLFFKASIHDAHCGMRAIKKEALENLQLKTAGMEFASEMVIKAIKNGFKINELAIDYRKRKGSSKLRSFADGWRHLRFMLLHSPLFLFFIPGAVLFLTGLVTMPLLYFNSLSFFGIKLFHHPMFLSALFIIIGYQLIAFALFAKTYAITHLRDKPVFEKFYKYITIEKVSIAGILFSALGAVIYIAIFLEWLKSGFGELYEVKKSIVALTLIVVGIQTVFSSFMLSILGIKEK